MAVRVIIDDPELSDCLFGRGMALQQHPGNRLLRCLVEHRADRYRIASAGARRNSILDEIVGLVKEHGRFLKRSNGGGWEAVSHAEARAKVGHTMRSRIRSEDLASGKLQASAAAQDARSSSSGLVSSRIDRASRGLSMRVEESVDDGANSEMPSQPNLLNPSVLWSHRQVSIQQQNQLDLLGLRQLALPPLLHVPGGPHSNQVPIQQQNQLGLRQLALPPLSHVPLSNQDALNRLLSSSSIRCDNSSMLDMLLFDQSGPYPSG